MADIVDTSKQESKLAEREIEKELDNFDQEKILQSKKFCDKREEMYRPFHYFMSMGNDNEAETIYRGLCNSKICQLDTKCRFCNRQLLRSDLFGYHSVCLWCEENFYSFEENN